MGWVGSGEEVNAWWTLWPAPFGPWYLRDPITVVFLYCQTDPHSSHV